MRARGAAIQGALAVIGLATAWATWQREPEKTTGEAMVVDASKRDLVKIRWDDGNGKVVDFEPGPGGEGVWLRVGARPKEKVPERLVRGSDAAAKLFEKFAPLRAARALGALGPEKLKELALDAPKRKLEISTRGGSKTTLLVGTPPVGASAPYVKDERDGRVYLLAGSVISEMESAPGWLVDRKLHGFEPIDWDALRITFGAKQRELTQKGADQPLTAKLIPADKPDKPDEMAKNWHDKVWRLIATDVLGKDEVPASGQPAIALRIDYKLRGRSVGFIEVGKVQAPAPTQTQSGAAPAAPPAEYFVRTEHTAGWVKVPTTAEEIVKEAEKVASGS